MASSILEALLGANQEAQAENPYASYTGITDQVSQSLADPRVVQQYGLKDTAIASLLSGLVGGGLQQLGTNYTDKQSNLYQNALINSMSGNTAMPEGMNENLFKKAQEQAKLFKIQKVLQDSTDKAELDKLFKSTKAKTKAEKLGELEAYNDDSGTTTDGKGGSLKTENPLNPLVKEKRTMEDALRNEVRNSPTVTGFADVKNSFDTMKSVAGFNDKASDLAFISSFARLNDPGGTVKEGEYRNVQNTQGILDKLGYSLDSLVNGKQSLSPDVKLQIMRAAGAKYNEFGTNYNSLIEKNRALAKLRGINSENIYGPLEYNPFKIEDFSKGFTTKTLSEQLNPVTSATQPITASTVQKMGADGKMYNVRDLGNGKYEIVE